MGKLLNIFCPPSKKENPKLTTREKIEEWCRILQDPEKSTSLSQKEVNEWTDFLRPDNPHLSFENRNGEWLCIVEGVEGGEFNLRTFVTKFAKFRQERLQTVLADAA